MNNLVHLSDMRNTWKEIFQVFSDAPGASATAHFFCDTKTGDMTITLIDDEGSATTVNIPSDDACDLVRAMVKATGL
jgi:hypothetical protein